MFKFSCIGQEIAVKQTNMEKCLEEMRAGGDPEYEKAKRQQLLEEYEKSLEHKYVVPPHGIQPVNTSCAYPVHIGKVHPPECEEEPEGAEGTLSLFHINFTCSYFRSTNQFVHTETY